MAKAELAFQKLRQLPPQERQSLEAYLLQFEQNWHGELFPEYAKEIPKDLQSYRLVCLVELVLIDMERQWKAGRCVQVEDYLANLPELGNAETVNVELLLAECQVREMAGEQSVMAKVAERFPKRGTELNDAFQQRDVSWSERTPTVKSPKQATRETKRVAKNKKTTPKKKGGSTPPPLSELPCQFGRYRIEKELGAGGMGAVYLAHDTQLDRPVALKIPKFEGNESDEMLDRFYREARSAATLRHSNICPVFDVDQIEGTHFLTMAYLDGRPLEDYIKKAGSIPERTAASLIRKVALGLEQAHGAGVIHRDLKPANIMIDRQKEPVITDFGLARNVNAGEESRVTKHNMIMGTPAYMSPEQVDGALDLGPLSDLYSLGVILYELLTGCLPFDGPISVVLGGILYKEPPPPSEHRPDLDPEIESICLKMMAKEPNERYAEAREVVDVLTSFLKGTQPTRTLHPEDENEELDSRQTYSDESGLSDFLGILEQKHATATPSIEAKSRSRRRKSRLSTLLGLVAFGLMALALYGVVLQFRGPDGGTLRVEVNDPNLSVLVDGDSLTLTDKIWEGEKAANEHTLTVKLGDQRLKIGSPTVIHLPDGTTKTHKLQLQLNGIELTSDTFEIARGQNTVVKISHQAATQPPSRVTKSTNPTGPPPLNASGNDMADGPPDPEPKTQVATNNEPVVPESTVQIPTDDKNPESKGKSETPPVGGPPAKVGPSDLLAKATYKDKAWVPLTNGKDMTGWSGFNARKIRWEVKGPVLSARNPSNRVESGGAIFTIAEYRDFHFRCDVLALSDGGGTMLFRNTGGVGKGRRRGYGLQNLSMKSNAKKENWGIGSLFADDFQVFYERTRLMPSSQQNLGIHSGDWYRLEFIALGEAVEVRINGKTTASYSTSDTRLTKAGKIGLNCPRGSMVVYRNLEIRELNPH